MSGAEARARVLRGALDCVTAHGFAGTTVADVARAAGVSRASVYRWFPGGRDEIFAATVAAEVGRFYAEMAAVVADAPDLAGTVERALAFAHRAIRDHGALQALLAAEPERLLGLLDRQHEAALGWVTDHLRPVLAAEAAAGRVRPGVDLDRAARFVATVGISVMTTPGRCDLGDPAAVRAFVRDELLAGIMVRPGGCAVRDPGVTPTGPS